MDEVFGRFGRTGCCCWGRHGRDRHCGFCWMELYQKRFLLVCFWIFVHTFGQCQGSPMPELLVCANCINNIFNLYSWLEYFLVAVGLFSDCSWNVFYSWVECLSVLVGMLTSRGWDVFYTRFSCGWRLLFYLLVIHRRRRTRRRKRERPLARRISWTLLRT